MKHAYTLSKTSLLSVLMIFSVVFACKDDKDPNPDPPVETDPIVATWQLTSIAPEAAGTTIPALDFIKTLAPCYLSLKLTFKSDKTVTAADCATAVSAIDAFVPISGATWKTDSGKLTLSKGTTTQSFNYTQTSTELKVIVNTNTDATKPAVNAVLTFKKV